MHKRIYVYDNSLSARNYLSYITEQAGGFACIGRDGKLYIKIIGKDVEVVPLKYFQNFKWGEKTKITNIKYENGIESFEKGNNMGNTIFINQENMYIVDQEQINNIYNQLNGMEIYSFEGTCIINPAVDIGDLLLIDGKYVIYQGSVQYAGKFKVNISSKIQSKEKQKTTIKTVSQKIINRRVQSRIDREALKITQLVEQTSEHEEKLTKQEQDINSIKQNIESITDYSRESDGITEIHLVGAGNTYIKKLKIDGNKKYENNLFPRKTLYPGTGIYPNRKGG